VFILRVPPIKAEEFARSNHSMRDNSAEQASVHTALKATPVLGQSVTWTNLINCIEVAGGLRKTAKTDSLDATARSQQAITSNNGYVEFRATEANGTRYLGLSSSPSASSPALIDFAIKLTMNGAAEIRESNGYGGETKYKDGDVFRIAIEDNQVKYYKNGEMFYSSLRKPLLPLFVVALIGHANASIGKATLSSGTGSHP